MAYIITFIVVSLVALIGLNFFWAFLFGFGITLYLIAGQTIILIPVSIIVRFIFPEVKNINNEKYITNMFANLSQNSKKITIGLFLTNLLILIIVPCLIKPILIIPALLGLTLSHLSDILGAKLQGDNSQIGIIFGKKW